MAKNLSKKLSKILTDLEIGKWKFASTSSDIQKTLIASQLISLECRAHLLCRFNHVSGANTKTQLDPIEGKRLAAYISQQNSTSPTQILKKLKATKDCMDDWEKAKKANDFSLVEHSLQRLVNIKKQEAEERAKLCNLSSAYDAILDQQTPGLSQKLFDKWDKDLSGFCKTNLTLVKNNFSHSLSKSPDLSSQNKEILVKSILTQMDLDLGQVTFGESAHPMCLGNHDKVVLGFVYNQGELDDLLLTISHEGGHALYRQNLPSDKKDMLSGRISGAGIDEAMALIFENHVCKNKDYLFFISRFIKNRFGEPFKTQLDHHHLHNKMIKPSDKTIRVLSDELRYPLDVILRYRLEKALFDVYQLRNCLIDGKLNLKH
jgi:carboxypeptidase Taq